MPLKNQHTSIRSTPIGTTRHVTFMLTNVKRGLSFREYLSLTLPLHTSTKKKQSNSVPNKTANWCAKLVFVLKDRTS